MNDIISLIITILTLLFGVAFLSWGIYQIKTGKMVAKRVKNTVDEPKQVGVIFVFVSLIGFWLAYNYLVLFFSSDPSVIFNLLFAAIEIGFVTTAAIYGLIKKRIFGFKNTGKIKKNVSKYYLVVNVAMLISVLSVFALFSNIVIKSSIITGVVAIINLVSLVTATFLMVKIEHDSRK